MNKILSLLLIFIMLLSVSSSSLAAKSKATPTPPPIEITEEVLDPPEEIATMLSIAEEEWETTAGKKLKKSNKYTKWWNNYEWEWCAGFVTWCMLEAGIPQDFKEEITKTEESSIEGLYHVKASSPGRMLEGYLHMHRTTEVPQKGFVVLYGVSSNKYVHVGIIIDVQPLGNGRFRLTTIEGNMSNTVKKYVYDYDMFAENKQKNISAVPAEEQTEEEAKNFTYKTRSDSKNKKNKWYVNCFFMPWLP